MGCSCFYDKRRKSVRKKIVDNETVEKNKITTKEIKSNTGKYNAIDRELCQGLNYDKQFEEDALNENNELRAKHGVDKLVKDQYLCDRAYIIAKKMLIEETYENANLLYENGDELGMNCIIYKTKLDGKKIMDMWYDEKEEYDFQEPKEYECYNFTQMIWKNSKNFGIGYYFLEKNENEKENANDNHQQHEEDNQDNKTAKNFCCVAFYYPAGNKPGKYKANIQKLKKIPTSDKSDKNGVEANDKTNPLKPEENVDKETKNEERDNSHKPENENNEDTQKKKEGNDKMNNSHTSRKSQNDISEKYKNDGDKNGETDKKTVAEE